ncbi:MAG: hypothetical protein AB1458_09070 [Bacteroidota bacterium]
MTNFGLTLLSNDVRQNYGQLYYPDYLAKNDAASNALFDPDFNKLYNGIGIYTVSVRYSGAENKLNRGSGKGVFFRMVYYSNPILKNKEVNYNNGYAQIQFGISKSLEDLWKFINPF